MTNVYISKIEPNKWIKAFNGKISFRSDADLFVENKKVNLKFVNLIRFRTPIMEVYSTSIDDELFLVDFEYDYLFNCSNIRFQRV